eukprot:150884_1
MRRLSQHWNSSSFDKLLYLGAGGIGSFAFYHYQIEHQLRAESMFLKIKRHSIPASPIYSINLNREQLEHEYAQFILNSTIHQIKSVITVATAPKNSGKSTVFIGAAHIIADALKHKNNGININWNTMKRFKDSHVVYLNLEQGFRYALKVQFGINSESEIEALTLLSVVLGSTIKDNKCLLLLFDSCGDINNDMKLKNKFCRMLKHLCDSGHCYIFCLSSPGGVDTFDHNVLNNGRKYIFEDDRFLLNEKEKLSLISAGYYYDGNVTNVIGVSDNGDMETNDIEEVYGSMKDEDEVKGGVIGDLLSYLNQSYFVGVDDKIGTLSTI